MTGNANCAEPMKSAAAGTRLAVAQLRMHWTIEDNLAAITGAMATAQRRGAAICAFAELAVTGFHREIVSLARPSLVKPALRQVRDLAARLGQAVAIGAPTFGTKGARFNSHLLIDEAGKLAATVRKNGLTAPEATFFEAGSGRPSAALHGIACTAVICREIEDHEPVLRQIGRKPPAIIFWPGQMRPDPAKPVTDPPGHVVNAQKLARGSGSYVVQTNWPNALNRPEESEHTGHSACISPTGELLFRLPKEASGVGVFNLGEREFEWHPQ